MTGLMVPVAASGAPSMVNAAASAKKVNPETAKRGPTKDLGYYLGFPSATYQWHGCTMTSSQQAPFPKGSEPVPLGMDGKPMKVAKGTKQGKVRFTTVNSNATHGWTMRWQVKNTKKFTICGVQVAGGFSRRGVNERYVAQAGYTSKPGKGSTVSSGGETFKVKVPKREYGPYAGKKLDTKIIYAVTVFIKKKK
jgi:hypothetical protein